MSIPLNNVYDRLLAAFGPQNWWPGETPFEIMVGAVLVQNTNWRNVAQAIHSLRDNGLLEPKALDNIDQSELEELIRPAGYFRVKAKRLRSLLRYLIDRYDGSLDAMFACDLATLREELLTIHGIGPETADSILLYAGGKPTFVVDTYTGRVLVRHGWVEPEADYYQVQELFHEQLPLDAAQFNEFHALFVQLGKQFCKKSQPKCDGCPLESLLPTGGICEF
jgi:endonuclease-3 related protein